MHVETAQFYMLISVAMGAEAAKFHRRSQRGQSMLNLTHKTEPQLASGETALQDQYLRAQTAKRLSRVRFTFWNIDDSYHHKPPAAASQTPDVWSDTRYLLARKNEDMKFKINSIFFKRTFVVLLGRHFFFFDEIQLFYLYFHSQRHPWPGGPAEAATKADSSKHKPLLAVFGSPSVCGLLWKGSPGQSHCLERDLKAWLPSWTKQAAGLASKALRNCSCDG